MRAFLRQQRRADATDETLDAWMAALHDARFLPVMAGAEVRATRRSGAGGDEGEARRRRFSRPSARRSSAQLSS